MGRRADGELELEILGVLWDADGLLTPGQVREKLTADLAYTSVATVLTRLVEKGVAERQRIGRTFSYGAATTREEWNSARMSEVLKGSRDHRAVLANFVGRLSRHDVEALRELLKRSTK